MVHIDINIQRRKKLSFTVPFESVESVWQIVGQIPVILNSLATSNILSKATTYCIELARICPTICFHTCLSVNTCGSLLNVVGNWQQVDQCSF